MNKLLTIQTMVIISLLLLGCYASGRQEEKVSNIELKREGRTQKVSILELKHLYASAKSANELRSVCLRAIDEGVIYRGGPVSSIDTIFIAHFAANLPRKNESVRMATIDFVPFVTSSDDSMAAGHFGWYLAFNYDHEGNIQNYYLSNLHK